MTDFGATLRQARERRSISLREIATRTKISVAALEALERNDVSKLPGGIFSRSFVRSYAAEVGLDPDQTVREFLDRFQGEPVTTGSTPPPIPEEEAAFERRKRRMAIVFVLAVVGMLVLSGVVVYFVLLARPDSRTPAEAAEGAPVISPGLALPPTTADAPGATATAAPGKQAGVIQLDIHPSAPCWISAVVDGEKVLGRVVEKGERQTLAVRELAVVTVGDAGAFAYSIDGKPGRALGAAGEVKTARITRQTVGQYVR